MARDLTSPARKGPRIWRRFWRWLRCDHRNALESINFDGWNITACRICGRSWMHCDGADPAYERERAVRVIDCEKPVDL